MTTATKFLKALFLIIMVLAIDCHAALAKKPLRKLIMQTPIFDTSLVPPERSPFKLKIDHTDIVYPEDPSKVLHARTGIMDISAEQNGDILKGKVSEEHKDSLISTVEYGVKPRFFVDLRKLEAKYAPDLDLSKLLEGELSEARKRAAAEVARDERLMEAQLHALQPHSDMPNAPLQGSVSDEDAKRLKAELDKSRKLVQLDARKDSERLKLALNQAQIPQLKMPPLPDEENPDPRKIPASASDGPRMPGFPDLQALIPKMPQLPKMSDVKSMMPKMPDAKDIGAKIDSVIPKIEKVALPSVQSVIPNIKMPNIPKNNSNVSGRRLPPPSQPEPDLATPEKLMNEQLAHAKLTVPANLDTSAELRAARERANAAVKGAQPAMNAILTQLRTSATLSLPNGTTATSAQVAEQNVDSDAKSIIEWDKWHARFADLAKAPILKAVNQTGNVQGANTVEITVLPSRKLTVRLLKSNKTAFDQAIVQAYRSLDGNSELAYPGGSRRSSITFYIDNKHMESGAPTGVKSQTSVGDKEVLKLR